MTIIVIIAKMHGATWETKIDPDDWDIDAIMAKIDNIITYLVMSGIDFEVKFVKEIKGIANNVAEYFPLPLAA